MSLLVPSALSQCELQSFAPPTPEDLDVFGYAVALDGSTAVFGSIGADDVCPTDPNCDSGSAFVWEDTAAGWIQVAELIPGDPAQGHQFGNNVAISGDRILVGAHLNGAGAAYVFVRSGGTWTQEQKLTGSDSQAFFHFAHSVALDGDTALIGVMRDTHAGGEAGSAFVFRRIAGTWTELAKLTASDAAPSDRLGRSCDLDGDVAILGAHQHDHGLANSGAAYIYERFDNGTPNDPLDDTWSEVTELRSSNPVAGALFGRSVGISGTTIVVGSSVDVVGGVAMGSVYVYVYERTMAGWVEVQRLTPGDGAAGDAFGESVAIDGDRIVVGSAFDADAGPATGSAYLYERTPAGWAETAKILASDAAPGSVFGAENTVDVSGNLAVFGAPLSDTFAPNAGSTYVFDLMGCIGDGYCDSVNNSTGVPGSVSAHGSSLAFRNDLTLDVTALPLNSFGFFIVSRDMAFIAMPGGSQGNLCLGGVIGRYINDIFNTGASGSATLQVDFLAIPSANGPYQALAGDTLHFQTWHRDSVGGAATSNFSRALAVSLN